MRIFLCVGVICLRLMAALRLLATTQLADCVVAWVKQLPLVSPMTAVSGQLEAEIVLTQQLSRAVAVTSPRPWLQWASLFHLQTDNEDDDQFPDESRSIGIVCLVVTGTLLSKT